MAITNQDSTEFTQQTTFPIDPLETNEFQGRERIAHFTHAQVGAGDADSTVELIKMPGGKVRITEIVFATSAFGASRVLDIGFRAHTNIDAVTAVAEDQDAFSANLDVSAAVDIRDLVDVLVESFDGFDIFAKVEGGTIPDLATLAGFIRYVRD